MNRSAVNEAISEALDLLSSYRVSLPEWAYWPPEKFEQHLELSQYLYDHQMGWDVTDFGSGDFKSIGLTLFCCRNGIQGTPSERPYAEKLLFVGENQVTPLHFHKAKMEDIINRGGGNLVFDFVQANRDGTPTDDPIDVLVDGEMRTLQPYEKLILQPGQSATMKRWVYHRFYAEEGKGVVLAGEVSQVNDDANDNYFFEPCGRFSEIVEDEATQTPLWNELTEGAAQ